MTSSRPSSSAIEAERTLIGSKFIDPNTLADLDIEITAKGLFNKYHQWIWNAWLALELASAAIDKAPRITCWRIAENSKKLVAILILPVLYVITQLRRMPGIMPTLPKKMLSEANSLVQASDSSRQRRMK